MSTTLSPYDTDMEKRSARKPRRVGPEPRPSLPQRRDAPGPDDSQEDELVPRGAHGSGASDRSELARETRRTSDPLLGSTIGRCRIEKLVGVGKTARVYQARHEALEDRVAVKVLRRRIAEHESLVSRFQAEARVIATLDNENVLKIYDLGTEAGRHYMVVELLEGEEILALIQREGQIEVIDALRIIRQAANGLSAAHERELVHRDVKPENLFLLDDGTVKVLDFGLAMGFDKSNERVGTPHYMAPEVCKTGAISPANDIYGLGISLFHLLTGSPPYAGRDRKGILAGHLAGHALHPERQRPGLSKEVADLVRLLTKRDPDLRPTAAEVVEALDRIGGKGLREKTSLKRRRKRSRSRLAVARRERSGKRVPVLAVAVAVISAAAIAILALSSGDRGRKEPDAVPARGVGLADELDAPSTPSDASPAAEARVAKDARVVKEKRETEAREALKRAEAFARKTWHAPADTDAVLSQYMSVWHRHQFTAAGKEAKRRAQAIKRKKVHPHPDRTLASKSDLAEAKKVWKQSRPKVERLIRLHDYSGASCLVPARVSDASGGFPRELDFWREHTRLLKAFQGALVDRVAKLAVDKRAISTSRGESVVIALTARSFQVRAEGRAISMSWADVGAETISGLAAAAFESDSARLLMLRAAFAFAHRLKEDFWEMQLGLGATHGAEAYDRQKREYAKRYRALGK